MVAMNENRPGGGDGGHDRDGDCGDDCGCCGGCDDCAPLPEEEALARLRAWEAEMMGKHGWYAHVVGDDDQSPTGFNAHTHGMEAEGGLDFQVVLPVPAQCAHSILANLVKVSKERELAAGQDVDGVLQGYKVRLALATECGREVLRAILPDREGRLGADADEPFNNQAEGCLPA